MRVSKQIKLLYKYWTFKACLPLANKMQVLFRCTLNKKYTYYDIFTNCGLPRCKKKNNFE